MKLIVKTSKPRNPLVAASLKRKAGSHRESGRTLRQKAEHALRTELQRNFAPIPKPSP